MTSMKPEPFQQCTRCGGEGLVSGPPVESKFPEPKACSDCNGTGVAQEPTYLKNGKESVKQAIRGANDDQADTVRKARIKTEANEIARFISYADRTKPDHWRIKSGARAIVDLVERELERGQE